MSCKRIIVNTVSYATKLCCLNWSKSLPGHTLFRFLTQNYCSVQGHPLPSRAFSSAILLFSSISSLAFACFFSPFSFAGAGFFFIEFPEGFFFTSCFPLSLVPCFGSFPFCCFPSCCCCSFLIHDGRTSVVPLSFYTYVFTKEEIQTFYVGKTMKSRCKQHSSSHLSFQTSHHSSCFHENDFFGTHSLIIYIQ